MGRVISLLSRRENDAGGRAQFLTKCLVRDGGGRAQFLTKCAQVSTAHCVCLFVCAKDDKHRGMSQMRRHQRNSITLDPEHMLTHTHACGYCRDSTRC